MMKIFFQSLVFLALLTACQKQPVTVEAFLNEQTELQFDSIATDTTLFQQSYLVWVKQPLDHKHPEKGSFKQRVWFSFRDVNAPVVMVTEGYSARRNYTSELARLTNANQIIVEHRYFDSSIPDSLDWQYLTVEQAANDHHHIIQLFKKFYKGKWMTTGISKGGQCTIFHRAYFPNDVDISVPYVAPVNLAREDHRLFDFFHQVGSDEARNQIIDFQRRVLENRDEMMKRFVAYVEEQGYTYRMGYEKAFDLIVLEYPFSFWQWGSQPSMIPSKEASLDELFDHLKKGSDFGYVSDQDWEGIKPFFYQAYKELGYYAYVPGELKPMLKGYDQDTISSCIFAPGGDTLRFVPETMQFVMEQINKNDPKIIALVGGNDPWGSTSIVTGNRSNTLKAIQPNGSHLTRINTLPEEMKQEVISTLNTWLE
ncbi:peptidase [Marinilabiliaceae bacterium JC017]|nr:peptidase [Marinilabiliaceae bacterium JC017]